MCQKNDFSDFSTEKSTKICLFVASDFEPANFDPVLPEVDANDLVNNGPMAAEAVFPVNMESVITLQNGAQSTDSVVLDEDKLLAINEDEYFANGDYKNLYIDEDALLADDDNANGKFI